MTKITTDWETGDLGPTVHTKIFALHDWWFGEDARAGEATIQPSITRLSSYLSGTAMFPLTCGPDGDTAVVFGPKLVLLNNPDLLMEAVTHAGGVVITATEAYTDLDATVKATPGQPVAALRNAGGGDIIATQATADMRPAYGVHPAGGLRNRLPNNSMAGAAVGVLGSGGSLPDGWSLGGIALSAVEVLSIAPKNGRPNVRVRLNGTPTGHVQIAYSPVTSMAAAAGQPWTLSSYIQQVGGSLTGIESLNSVMTTHTSAGAFISGPSSVNFTSTSTDDLRRVGTATLAGETVAFVRGLLQITHDTGAIDITLDVSAPQFEQAAEATNVQITSLGGLNVTEVPFRQVSYLKPDAVDDFMTLSTAFEPEGAYTIAAAVAGVTSAIFGGVNGATSARQFTNNASGGSLIYRVDGTGNQASAGGAGFLQRNVHVIRVEDATTGAIWLNGTALTTTRVGNLTPTRHDALFRGGAFYGGGRFYGGALIPAAITETSRTRLQRYLAFLSGVDL